MKRKSRFTIIPSKQFKLKEVKVLFLRRLLLVFLTYILSMGLFCGTILYARPNVGVLNVKVVYPSQGQEWLELFLQEELTLQLQLNNIFSVSSADFMQRWNQRIHNTSSLNASPNSAKVRESEIKKLKLDRVLQISIQKVIDKLAVTWTIEDFNTKSEIRKFRKIHTWKSPDELMSQLIDDLINKDVIFSKLMHYPQVYSWEAIKELYQWKQKMAFAKNIVEKNVLYQELDLLLSNDSSIAGLAHFHRAVLLTINGSMSRPVFVPTLNLAETELMASMELYPGNAEHHALLSLLHYLRREPLFAKQQANIANKINPRNGVALILYGLTIGKKIQDGAAYIKQGLQLYPFIADPSPDNWQPFHALMKDIEPWLQVSSSENELSYDDFILKGQDFYQTRRWQEAQKIFEDAQALEPTLAEAPLYLARIKLGQNDFRNAISLLAKLRKRFPKHPDIALYYGYAHEKVGNLVEAENLYRNSLNLKPEHHKALLRLGAVLMKRGKQEEARSFLESLTQKYPIYTVAWWNLGILYYQLGELLLAESAWEESLRLEPDNNQVRVRLERLKDEISMSSLSR